MLSAGKVEYRSAIYRSGKAVHRNERQAHSDDSIPVIGNAGALQRMYGYVRAL